MKLREPRMVWRLRHRLDAGAVAETQIACSTTEERPTVDTHVFGKAEFLDVKLLRCFQVADGQYKRSFENDRHRADSFSVTR